MRALRSEKELADCCTSGTTDGRNRKKLLQRLDRQREQLAVIVSKIGPLK